MTKDEALRLALDALESNRRTHHCCEDTWYSCPKHEDGCANDSEGDECNCGADKANAGIDKAITAIKAALEAKDEPVAWMCADESLINKGYARFSHVCMGEWKIPVYITPPQRTWVGLTDEEKHLFSSWLDHKTDDEVFTAIEAKLKEKNT